MAQVSSDSAFTSKLTLHFGDSSPEPSDAWPSIGDVTDATDESLKTLRRVVVEPVVQSLLTAQELEELTLHSSSGDHPGEAWVRLRACGEVFEEMIYSPDWFVSEPDGGPDRGGPPDGAALVQTAAKLASDLEDWIAESGFGWGQQRLARYQLPPGLSRGLDAD